MLRDPDEMLPAAVPSTSLGFCWDGLRLSISMGSSSDPFAFPPDGVTMVAAHVPPEGRRECSPGTRAALPSLLQALQFFLLASAMWWSPVPAPADSQRQDEAGIWRMGRCRGAVAGRRVPGKTWC